MPGPSRRAILASIDEHLADTNPHTAAKLVRATGSRGIRLWNQDTFPDIDADYLNGTDPDLAHEGDRLTLEEAE